MTTSYKVRLKSPGEIAVTDLAYGAGGDGSAADGAFAAAVAACPTGGTVKVPAGSYLLTNLAINKTITIVGDGDGSIINVGTNNSNIFSVTGSNVTFRNLQIAGDGTATSSANGNGIVLTGAGLVVENCLITDCGFAGITGNTSSSLQGPKIDKCRFVNNGGVSGAGGGFDMYMSGSWQHSQVLFCTFSTTLAYGAIFFSETGSAVWYDVQIRGGSVEGYQRYAITCTDESWDGTDRVYGFLVDGVSIKNVQWQGIKCKVSRGIRITNCILDNCSQVAENSGSGLYGSIFVNSLDRVVISGNEIRTSGCDGIRVQCGFQYPNWNPHGQACSQFVISNNIIQNPGNTQPTLGNGITAANPMKQLVISGNSIRGAPLHAIQAFSTATIPMWDVGLFNNTVVDNPTTSNAILVSFATTLRMDGNICQNSGVNVVSINDTNTVLIGASDISIDPVATSGRGYSFSNISDLVFSGKTGNTIYAAWVNTTAYTQGQRVQNSNGVYQCVIAGTSAGSGGPTGTGPVVTDGTVTWYYVGYYKGMTTGLVFTNTIGTVIIGDTADFQNLIGAQLGSGINASYRRANIASDSATFASAATKAVTLSVAETDALYKVSITGSVNETFWVTSKATGGFTLNSSNATSTAVVDWVVSR